MQQFQELYNSKLTTPDEAVSRCLHSGAVCASDIALAHSSLFYEAVGRAIAEGRLDDITQHTLLDTGAFPFYRPEFAGKYHGVSWFSQGPARKAINGGFADVMPAYYRDIPGLFQDYVKPEVLIAVVSPMDKHGYFSTGCDGSLSAALFATAGRCCWRSTPICPEACPPRRSIFPRWMRSGKTTRP